MTSRDAKNSRRQSILVPKPAVIPYFMCLLPLARKFLPCLLRKRCVYCMILSQVQSNNKKKNRHSLLAKIYTYDVLYAPFERTVMGALSPTLCF